MKFRWKIAARVTLAAALCVTSVSSWAAVTVLYNDQTVEIDTTLADPTDLWVSPADLTRINGFVLKPEGACLDDICIPVRQDEDNEMVVTRNGAQWFNVSEFAKKLGQAAVHDADTGTWSFGEIPATRAAFLEGGIAPDFAIEGRDGKVVRLSDFRGKKVLIMTWASW